MLEHLSIGVYDRAGARQEVLAAADIVVRTLSDVASDGAEIPTALTAAGYVPSSDAVVRRVDLWRRALSASTCTRATTSRPDPPQRAGAAGVRYVTARYGDVPAGPSGHLARSPRASRRA